jgi:hypothetical protein
LKLLTTAFPLRLNGSLYHIHSFAGCQKWVVLVDSIDASDIFQGLHYTLLALTGGHTRLTHELSDHIVEGVNVAGLHWRLVFHS